MQHIIGTIQLDLANKLFEWTRFTIEEVDCDEYTSEISQSGNVTSLPADISVTNDRIFDGTLTIKKEIAEDVPVDEEFEIKIKLIDGAIDLPTEYEYTESKEGTLVFEDGVATITLKADESITIVGLPLNAKYKIEEESDEYDASYDSQEGTITEETSVTITNSVKQEEETVDEEIVEKVKEEDPTDPAVPHTGDSIIMFAAIGLLGALFVITIKKKMK